MLLHVNNESVIITYDMILCDLEKSAYCSLIRIHVVFITEIMLMMWQFIQSTYWVPSAVDDILKMICEIHCMKQNNCFSRQIMNLRIFFSPTLIIPLSNLLIMLLTSYQFYTHIAINLKTIQVCGIVKRIDWYCWLIQCEHKWWYCLGY